jgi:hypothetical protein
MGLSIVGIYLLLNTGTLEIDNERVLYRTPLASYAITWNEIQSIEIDAIGSILVLEGANKRLCTSGPVAWPKKVQEKTAHFIETQAVLRNIRQTTTNKCSRKKSRNTRLP